MDRFLIRKKKDSNGNDAKEVIIQTTEVIQAKADIKDMNGNDDSEEAIIQATGVIEVKTDIEDSNKSMSSDNDDDIDRQINVGTEQATKKRKSYKQRFKDSWIKKFEWLTHSENNEACCKICNKTIHGGITHLQRHETSIGHQKRFKTLKQTPKIQKLIDNKEERQFNETVKASELKCIMFIAEHNLPFRLLDHLPQFLRNVCPDSKVATKIKCGRKKGTQLCSKCVTPEQISILRNDLNNCFYSLIIDETTDVSATKSLVVVARYAKDFKISDKFLGLIEVNSGTAESLFGGVINLLQSCSINLENMISFAADNATVMQGSKSGVQARFKEVLPHIFVMGCVCHSFHLCASAACTKLPPDIEEFCRDICLYFAHSSKKIIKLREFQEFCEIETHKILKLSNTRWLSLQAVINRILEQWNALILFFTDEIKESKSIECINKATSLLRALRKSKVKVYFLFLSYILDLVNRLNLEFQSESLKIHVLLKDVSTVYKCILRNFMKDEILKHFELSAINVKNSRQYMDIEKMYFGANTEMFILESDMNVSDVDSFRVNALAFYIELTSQIKSRINFDDEVLNFAQILNPEVVFSDKFISLVPIIRRFPMLGSDLESLNREWRLLKEHEQFQKLADKNISAEKFWETILVTENQLGQIMFPNLKILISGLMCLAHSSAAAERIFSQVNLIKDKTRNRLHIDTVNSLLHTKEHLNKSNCFNFQPSKNLLKRNIQKVDVDVTIDDSNIDITF